jgi:rSAM/selenodomain-associated transferase 1
VTDVLYVAAKAPRARVAKTRLGNAIGDDLAVALYRAFLSDLARRFAGAPFELGWYVTPADAWQELEPLVGPARRVLVQGDGDWTERQRRLFRDAAARGEDRVVLVASDSPQLRVEAVSTAFRRLARHDLVIGPVADGGYYLLGMSGPHDVLAGVAMSTRSVTGEIRAAAAAAGLSVATLPSLFDVDEEADLARLRRLVARRSDLPATKAALAALV